MRIDPDLPRLAETIRTLAASEAPAPPDLEPSATPRQLEEAVERLRRRASEILASATAPKDVVAATLTDACAENLVLEAERLRTKRRMIAALVDAPTDPAEDVRAGELSERYRAISEAQTVVRGLVERLRHR